MGKASASSLSSGGVFVGAALVKEAQFNSRSNFGGKMQGQRVTACELLLEFAAGGGQTDTRWLYLTVNAYGKTAWKASEDGSEPADEGNFLYAKGDGESINDGTPFGRFLKSLFACNFEFEGGDVDASDLVGLKLDIGAEDAPVEKSKDRKLNYVIAILESLPWEEDGEGGGKPKFKKSGELPKGVQKSTSKKKDEDEEEEEEEEAEETDEEEEAEEVEEEGTVDKTVILDVMAAVMAKNAKGLKIKQLGTAVFDVIGTKFKKLAGDRKQVAAACKEFVEAGTKNKVFTYDEDSGTISVKK